MLESEGEISPEDGKSAVEEMTGLFELFEDDDVLDMFEMEEPADAALARHNPLNQQLGVADQRIESWFEPFSWAAPTGYLVDRATGQEDEDDDSLD